MDTNETDTNTEEEDGVKYDEVIMGRRSIRGFSDKPVTKDVIRDVVSLAVRSPSSMNTQPWHLHIVTGEPLDRIREGNTERNLAGVPASRGGQEP